MTDKNQISAYDTIGEAFGQDEDPYEAYDQTFKALDEDPIEIYRETKIQNEEITSQRRKTKERSLRRWREHMAEYERHPACPSTNHAIQFIDKLVEKEYVRRHVNGQLNTVSRMFDYWANHPSIPHGTDEGKGYNPIDAARELREDEIKKLPVSKKKTPHRMTIEELSHQLRSIENILHRAVIMAQFKYGSRSGQVRNIKISDVKIQHEELKELYPDLGSHPRLDEFDDEDVVYFPPRDQRPGVKSQRPIVMPIDAEMRRVLIRYLRRRPPVDEDWLFVTNSTGSQLRTRYIGEKMWKPAFHPEYAETDEYEAVNTHYARHRFSTYWRKEIGLNRELVKYMRGDVIDSDSSKNHDSLDDYVHTYYEDVREEYLANIYRFNI